MERMTAGLSIRTRYLAERYPYQGRNLYLHCTGNGFEVDFMGKVTGENARYKPPTFTDEQGDAYAPPFRIFPTQEEECIEVEIYRGQEKLCTITQDNELHLLRAEAGKQTDIEIDFRKTEIRVFVKSTAMGEKWNRETENVN